MVHLVKRKEAAEELLRRRRARENLIDYATYIQSDYNAAKPHYILAERLEAVERGEIKRLLVTEPPQHGKSRLVSVHFPCWYLAHHPEKNIVQTSYAVSLALFHSRRARDFFVSPEFKILFPGILHKPKTEGQKSIQETRQTAQEWGTIYGGSYYAVGIGGGLTGRGMDIGIIDDPVKDASEANSETISNRNWDWYSQVFRTRLSPDAAIIVTMTRWSKKDLMQKILDNMESGDSEKWDILHMPALAVEGNPNDPTNRKPGEALWPWKFNREWLLSQKYAMDFKDGSKAFESLYQGNPTIAEGEIFKRDWWKYYNPKIEHSWSFILQSWDTAFKDTKTADYSACTTWGIEGSRYKLINMWRGKPEFPELKQVFVNLYNKYKPNLVIAEDKASGQSLIQELKRGTRIPILPVKPDGNKIARANAQTPLIESGLVELPEGEIWLYDFIEELSSFPYGEHDDIVDSVVYALNELSKRSGYKTSIPYIGSGGGFGSIDSDIPTF